MSQCEVGPDDKPINPPCIFDTEVVINPFDDI
jgi:hypothetical protein